MTREDSEHLIEALRAHREALDKHREEINSDRAKEMHHSDIELHEKEVDDLRTLLHISNNRCAVRWERITQLEAQLSDRNRIIDQLRAAKGRDERAAYHDGYKGAHTEELLSPPGPRCTCADQERLLWCTCGGRLTCTECDEEDAAERHRDASREPRWSYPQWSDE